MKPILEVARALGIDPATIRWPRVIDVNDRALRRVMIGLGEDKDLRETEFHITAASEGMAILCLARDVADLKARLGRIVVGRHLGERGHLVDAWCTPRRPQVHHQWAVGDGVERGVAPVAGDDRHCRSSARSLAAVRTRRHRRRTRSSHRTRAPP